jgi:hypothetical protein
MLDSRTLASCRECQDRVLCCAGRFPAGLKTHDFQGIFGYKVSAAVLCPQSQSSGTSWGKLYSTCACIQGHDGVISCWQCSGSACGCHLIMAGRQPCSILNALLWMCAVAQVFLTIAILMGEGMYMVGRVLLSSEFPLIPTSIHACVTLLDTAQGCVLSQQPRWDLAGLGLCALISVLVQGFNLKCAL